MKMHQSVLALLAEGEPGETSVDIIRRKARALVDEALQLNWQGPPFNPETLASLRGIEVVPVDSFLGSEARIFPKPDGQVRIEFERDRPKARINFSICHEISHTFFPDCYEAVRYRGGVCSPAERQRELESLCDIGAGELLMPHAAFSTLLSKMGASLKAMLSLSDLFDSSLEATLIRATQLGKEPFCAAVFSEKFKPSERRMAENRTLGFVGTDVRPKLRVDYAPATPSFDLYLPKDKSAPSDSVVYRALKTPGVHEAEESWEVKGFRTRRVQAVALPKLNGTNRVAVLFF